MPLDDRRRADALDRYWDAAQQNPDAPVPAELSPLAVALVARLRPRPVAARADLARIRLRQQLLHAAGTIGNTRNDAPPERPDPSRLVARALPMDSHRPLRQAAVIVLIFVTVALWMVLEPNPHPLPNAIPAARPGVEIDPVGSVTLPAGVVPRTGQPWINMGRVVLAPGEAGSVAPMASYYGVGVETVVYGSYAVESDGTMQVVRVGGAVSDVPPGTEVTLGPGESAIRFHVGAAQSWRNPGTTETVVMAVGFYSTNLVYVERSNPVGGVLGDIWAGMNADAWNQAALPDVPLRVTISRLMLAPGSVLPDADLLDPAGGGSATGAIDPTLRWITAGTVEWTLLAPGVASPVPDKHGMRYFANQQVPWTVTRLGFHVVLANPSKREPAVMWEVRISPAESSS